MIRTGPVDQTTTTAIMSISAFARDKRFIVGLLSFLAWGTLAAASEYSTVLVGVPHHLDV